ncbi:MAG: hypothetical protein JWP63_2978 [Candidatus Solibacter sp.]|nr:hypothetical protein [Candidatus Solibacter sp.]
MKFPWRSVKARSEGGASRGAGACYESESVVESQAVPGVRLRIARISFAGRLELMRRVRELARRAEFLDAGKDPADKMDAALLQAEIERLYVTWGVKAVEGLTVDGIVAGPDALAAGPESVFREALAAVRREFGLSEEERKNS